MFSIGFLQEKRGLEHDDMRYAHIVLNDFTEEFLVPLTYWSEADYRRHWIDGVVRVLSGELRSCLVTAMYEPGRANFLKWWALYRVGETVKVQEQLFFLAWARGRLEPFNPYPHIRRRSTRDEDTGGQVSEWTVDIYHFKSFVDSLNASSW